MTLRRGARVFNAASYDCEQVQQRMLAQLVANNRDTAWGRAYGFSRIDGPQSWQSQVPIVDYEALQPSIERIAAGESSVLSHEAVLMLEPTSGSGALNKLIPYTRGLREEFNAATQPWFNDLLYPGSPLAGGRSYWSISSAGQASAERSSGGLAIGFADDTEYFAGLEKWFITRLLAVGPEVARVRDFQRWRHCTLSQLVAADDLTMISVWSPSFASQLLAWLEADWLELSQGLSTCRRRQIDAQLQKDGFLSSCALWPNLGLISCWSSGSSADQLPELRRRFPKVQIQGKGLLATEGVVSFPLQACIAPVAAIASHVLEFVDLEHLSARPRFAHELRVGGHYSPLLSTRGGLYRYRLGDEVRCVAHHRTVPQLEFLGRTDGQSDLCGEKLGIREVNGALDATRRSLGEDWRFVLVAPEREPQLHYALFVDGLLYPARIETVARHLEAQLQRSHHYQYCRRLEQLGPVRGYAIEQGWNKYCRRHMQQGCKLGDIKHRTLESSHGWAATFGVGLKRASP